MIELPLMELEKAEKGVRVAETVLAVSQDEKTNYGSSCTIVLTTYRWDPGTIITGSERGFQTPDMYNYTCSFMLASSPGRFFSIGALGRRKKSAWGRGYSTPLYILQ